MKEADKGGDLVSKSELEQQRLKMRIMTDRLIDRKVEKSESRVIAAIAELNRKVDGLAAEVASLSSKVTETGINVSGRMNFHTLTVVALLVAVIFAAISSS